MKIVIDIPDDEYEICLSHRESIENMIRVHKCFSLEYAVIRGTPLPKGCGRLIDADELLSKERPNGIADDVWRESHVYKMLTNAPTIIETNKK